jgi:hypothetical protein
MRMVHTQEDKLKLIAMPKYETRYSNSGFVGPVAQFVAGLLPRATQRLDGPSSRHVLVDACGHLMDFELGSMRLAKPEDRLSKRVPYRFEPYHAAQVLIDLAGLVSEQFRVLEYAACPSAIPEVLSLLEAALPQSKAPMTHTHTFLCCK